PSAAAGPEAAAVAGVGEPLLSLAQAAADSVDGTAGEKAAELKRRFPCVADASVRRPWGEKRATITLALKSAVAPALRRGRPAGVLGADGSVFSAPEGVYRLAGPSADVGDASEDDRRALAREWPALTAEGAMPAPLEEMVWRSPEDGWEARLQDGTTVAWGRLDWTKEKLARLAEALADARAKAPGAFAADLRWFEDGKVLLKPVGLKAVAGVRGGLN
ncbi:MAG TPA: cell division protein FtsQ/DivIB, partial [Anaeromyxobacteraceae bacterium]|nr:cell division protein FtsQ/DivIB [Anaeromyxobacteraceae bacterium]